MQTEREFSKEALKPLDDLQAKHDQLQKEFIACTELSQKNVSLVAFVYGLIKTFFSLKSYLGQGK